MSLTPFQRKMRQGVQDWQMFQLGMEAFERISGIGIDEALNLISSGVNEEQRQRVIRTATLFIEFNNLKPEEKSKVLGDVS
jgi:hypothetical protein